MRVLHNERLVHRRSGSCNKMQKPAREQGRYPEVIVNKTAVYHSARYRLPNGRACAPCGRARATRCTSPRVSMGDTRK